MNRPLAVALLAITATLLAVAAVTSAQTDPPESGDWVVGDLTFYDDDHVLSGNLTVNNSGRLQLDNMTLTMSPPVDQAFSIFVEAGSTLELTNVMVRSSNADRHYWFECQGQVIVRSSEVRDVAANLADWDDWDSIAGGVQVYDASSILEDSKFHHNQRINVFVKGCNPTIEDCEFYDSEYVNTDDYAYFDYSLWEYIHLFFLDASGLFLNDAHPNITRCTFRSNAIADTAKPFYSDTYAYTGVLTFGRGLLAYQSSPNITNCDFQNNGEQPLEDRNVGVTWQMFFDSFTYQDVPEGGLACVGTMAHPSVLGSRFFSNDVFGIFGMDGGFPDLVDGCQLASNKYLRDSTVYSPSAAIQVAEGSGTMRVANTTASDNIVLANIYVTGPSLHLINFTNTANRVNNGYNIYLGDGRHRFEDCKLDGRLFDRNIYIGYSRNQLPRLRMEGCDVFNGRYGIYTSNYQGTNVYIANSTLRNFDTATFYLQSANVDCVNCTLPNLRIESYSWGRGSQVRIMYFLDVSVTWQNDVPIPGAFIQIFNATQSFVYGGIADENGTIGPIVITSRTILISSGSQREFDNSPLHTLAYSAGLQSVRKKRDFEENEHFTIVIEDEVEPTIYVFTPGDGHEQNTTGLVVRGMCTDVGSGIKETTVTYDNGTKWHRAGGTEEAWRLVLNMTEGTYTIKVRSEDVTGNSAMVVITDVLVDLTPPPLVVIDPVKDVWYTSQSNYTIRGRIEGDPADYLLKINRKRIELAPDGSWESLQDIHSGSNDFRIVAVDTVGNVFMVMKTIVSDETVPKLVLTSPVEGLWTNSSQMEVRGITELGATVRVNGEPILTFDGRFAYTIYLTEGVNDVIVEAIDRANNVQREVRRVNLDSIPPLLRVESPQGDGLVSQRMLPIRGTVDDPAVRHVIVNGLLVPVVEGRFEKEFRLDEGENPTTVEVWDKASNYVARSFLITLDTMPPMLEVLEPQLHLETRDPTVRIRGRADADATMTLWGEPQHQDLDLINLVRLENTFRYDEYPLVEGLNLIHLEVVDEVGNVARVTLQVVNDVEPPELLVTPMTEDTTSEIVTVTGILKDGSEVRINGVPAVLGPNGAFAESVHLRKGPNVIRLEAFDEAGNQLVVTANVTRSSVQEPDEGIMGAGLGLSIGLVIIMLVIGMLIIYPGTTAGGIEPEAMSQEPIIVTDEEETAQAPRVERPPDRPPDGPPDRPPDGPPDRPPDREGPEPGPPERPQGPRTPPTPPDGSGKPKVPPKPPWR